MATLSVITLTRNRLGKVRLLLERLLPQLGEGDEVLLIDTGSEDGTREHFAQDHNPHIQFVHYDGAGSWAEMRNFGVSRARGALIAFLDDDCLPAADWVARGKAALEEADAVGGIAQPHGIAAFPEWWHPDMGWMVGLSVPGHCGPDAGKVYYPTTSNLWVRASVARAVPFQELGGELAGEESAKYVTGREDAQWWRRLRVGGYRTRFEPGLCVGHAIDPARLDLDYLRRRAGLDGAAWAAREGTREDMGALAYQWWRQLFMAWGAPWADEESQRAHWHFHQLTRRRHGAAMQGLEDKFFARKRYAPLRWTQYWRMKALGRLAFDQSKTLARAVLRPWLRTRPACKTPARVERLAVIAFGFMGDMVILQSALRGLLKAHPTLEVYVLAPPSGGVILNEVRRLNVTVTPELKPRSKKARLWVERWLDRLDPDAIVAPYLHEPWGLTLLSIKRPPRSVVGFDSDQGLRRMRHLEKVGVRVHKDLALHESENLCCLFGEVGLPCAPEPSEMRPDAEALKKVQSEAWLEPHTRRGAPLVVLSPDAAQRNKEWDDEHWETLIRRVLGSTEAIMAVNLCASHPAIESCAVQFPERVRCLDKAPLSELIAWIHESDALVTVDSGPQHLGHALGVPTVTLYGPMDERRWTDRWHRPIHHALRACAADLTAEEKRGLAHNHEVSMIDPERVFEALREILNASGDV